jgi:predicted patatin/cPLA2 family phospholipase
VTRVVRALSLPGCGCRGAFQFAVLARLVSRGERFDLVGGASSGSITGAAYVAGKGEQGPDIYRTLLGTRFFSPRFLASERSPFGMSRIVREALERHIPEADIAAGEAELLVSTTPLRSLARRLLRRTPKIDDISVIHSSRRRRNIHDVILASCTFPPFYARLPKLDGEIHVDGGATDNTLFGELVSRGATHVTVITPHVAGTVYQRLFHPVGPPRLPPHVELRVIRPARPLRLRSFDFDPERLEEALSMQHVADVVQPVPQPSLTTR